MKTIGIKSIAAAHEVAGVIEGYGETLVLLDAEIDGSTLIRPNREFTEIELRGEYVSTARVSIERPDGDRRTRVTWSSSDSRGEGCGAAAATANLLAFAVAVARILDDWAERGQLPRLSPEPEFAKGDIVDVAIQRAGRANEPTVGTLRCVVVNVGGEYDVRLLDPSEVEAAEGVFEAAGGDVAVEDLRETVGGVDVYLLRNCQPEQLVLVSRAAA